MHFFALNQKQAKQFLFARKPETSELYTTKHTPELQIPCLVLVISSRKSAP